MSNSENRKSMDDVLASIRRIVRAEKEPDPMPTGDDPAGRSEDEPLALTPDMRMDEAGEVEPEAIARPAPGARDAAAPAAGEGQGAGQFTGAGSGAAPASPGAAANREALRRLVREVLVEELTGGGAEDRVRAIIRDELINGEIGGNISQNVLRLIQAEVARALDER